MRRLLAAATVLGCQTPPLDFAFAIEASAETDEGEPLAGVDLYVGPRRLGATDAAGLARARLRGRDGARLVLRLAEPSGLRAMGPLETMATLQVLTPLGGGPPQPQPVRITARFAPLARSYVVLVRTDGRAGLGVQLFGKRQGATNEAGVAQLLFRAPPGDELHVGLDTGALPALRPANPSRVFQLADRDDVLVFDQDFRVGGHTRVKKLRRARPAPQGPQRL